MKKCLSFKIKLRRKLWECCELLPGRVQMRWRREQKSHDEMSKDVTSGEERERETKRDEIRRGDQNEMWKTWWDEKRSTMRQNETRYRQGKKKRRVKRQHNSIWEEETLEEKEKKKDEMQRQRQKSKMSEKFEKRRKLTKRERSRWEDELTTIGDKRKLRWNKRVKMRWDKGLKWSLMKREKMR